ncbi:MAG: DUF4392 domain-containing protein [Thermococci archaeon]|nr:DUF4392 domain-containing protein [Thermococci archaeon]
MIAHIINTDIGRRGIGRVYLEYRMMNYDFLKEAAETFVKNVENVVIVTGFPVYPSLKPENDGPLGAVALYGAVERLGGRASVLTFDDLKEAMSPLVGNFIGREEADRLVADGEATLLISVESPGRARDGRYHSMKGCRLDIEGFDDLFIRARESGVPTIGIGDGGNEIGMGNVRGLVEKYVPRGEKIASTVEVDHLVTSGVSNWGAYGLVAEASVLSGKNLLPEWREEEVVRILNYFGIVDGVKGKVDMSVDGIPLDVHEGVKTLLRRVTEHLLKR